MKTKTIKLKKTKKVKEFNEVLRKEGQRSNTLQWKKEER